MTDTSGAGGQGSGSVSFLEDQGSAKKTEKKFKTRKTPRTLKGERYPNYWEQKDRSGNHIGMDSNKGKEAIYIQHRTGTGIELHPDGAMYVTSHNSKYEIIFGENRMTISGAQDLSIKGDASMRIFGDYNVTCHKDYNLTVLGDLNIVAKNKNQHIRGNMDTQAKNVNKKIEGQYNQQVHGATMMLSEGSFLGGSRDLMAYYPGATGLHAGVPREGNATFKSEKGNYTFELADGQADYTYKKDGSSGSVGAAGADKKVTIRHKEGSTDIKNTKDYKKTVDGDHTETTDGDHTVKSKTGNIQHKAEQGDMSYNATQGKIEIKADADKLQLKAGQEASLEGATTHVSGLQGDVHITSSGSINADPGGGNVNLAGGLGQMFPGLGQLSFLFGDAQDSDTVGDRTPPKSKKSKEEQDDSQTIQSWDDPDETSGLNPSSGTLPNA